MSEQSNGASGEAGNPRALTQFRYRFSNADFDESTGVLTVEGQTVALEPRPTRLLVELLRHVNEVVTKEELLDSVWEGRPTVDNVVANAINKLRKALGDEAGARVTNQPRIGYRLLGPVERMAVRRLPDNAELDLKPGQPVPHREGYRLERPLGNSGRNHVWLARHTKLGQERVFKFAVDADRLRSLKREFTLYRVLTQELGDRPCFAKVLEANFAVVPYFLESEYGGLDLLAWAEGGDRLKAMSLDERLALFVQIAEAIAASHSVGVLHKDIKPANVLVSGEPGAWVLKVTDFGSGQLEDASRLRNLGLTAMGLTVNQAAVTPSASGTPMYQAPEVFAGSSATSLGDVYALGVVLFQLVVADLSRHLATGWEQDVPDLLLREDISAATRGQQAQRLQSVSQLVERISALGQRHASERQAVAERGEAARLARRAEMSAARRPWMLAIAGTVAIAAVMLGWLYVNERAALQIASAQTRQLDAINAFLENDLLFSADVLHTSTQQPLTFIDLLRRASAQAGKRFSDQPALEAEVRHKIARSFWRAASSTDASEEYKRTLSLLDKMSAHPLRERVSARYELAQVQMQQGKVEVPAETIRRAESELQPAWLEERSTVAYYAWGARAAQRQQRQELDAAVEAAQRAMKAAQGLTLGGLSLIHPAATGLAFHLIAASKQDDAMEVLRTATATHQLPVCDAEASVSRAYQFVAHRMRGTGNYEGALDKLRFAKNAHSQCDRPSKLHLADIESDLGHTYNAMGRYDDAASRFAAAANGFEQVLGTAHQYYRITIANLANAEVSRGQHSAAQRLVDQHQDWFAKHSPSGRYLTLEIVRARIQLATDQPQAALQTLRFYEPPNDANDKRVWRDPGDAGYIVRALKAIAVRRTQGLAAAQPLLAAAIAETRAVSNAVGWLIDRLEAEMRAVRRPPLTHLQSARASAR